MRQAWMEIALLGALLLLNGGAMAADTDRSLPPAMLSPGGSDPAPPAAAPTYRSPLEGGTPSKGNDSLINPAASSTPADAQPVAVSMSMAQMGQRQGLRLGVMQQWVGVDFTLSGDRVVTHAQLDLALKVSPELAARNATLQLMLNGQPLGSVPLGAASDGATHYQLEIPAVMVVSANNLSFSLAEADSLRCEKDSDRYSLTILPETQLQLEGQQLNVGTHLSNFPRPFIEPNQKLATEVTMVFPQAVTPDEVSAAALVASWFGMLADGYGATFPVLRDALPEKSGIVFGRPGDKVGPLTLPAANGPTLQLIDNPSNPIYKLMLVIGDDREQLRQAAYRLANPPLAADGSTMAVTPQAIAPRKDYDAPRWINTERPVRLRELLRPDQSLDISGVGHAALRINFRAAPDLFLWDGDAIPLRIDYRFPTVGWLDESNSYLTVSLNDSWLDNLPVNKTGVLERLWHLLGSDARQESATLRLDPWRIYGYNQLQLYFNIKNRDEVSCGGLQRNNSNDNIKSQIKDDSSIDLSKTRHFSQLPNLSYFVGAAFPFSQRADFSQSLLMLPEKPSDEEIGVLLNLAGRAGDATGAMLTDNRVVFGQPVQAADVARARSGDVLAVTSAGQSAFNQMLFKGSPFEARNGGVGVAAPTLWQNLFNWLNGYWDRVPLDADRYLSSSEAWRGLFSFISPWNDRRVVVMAIGSSGEQLLKLPGDLNDPEINANVRGDTAIITDVGGVRSFEVGPKFVNGRMPWYMLAMWTASQHVVQLAWLLLLLAALFGWSFYVVLKRQARRRLHPEGDDTGKSA